MSILNLATQHHNTFKLVVELSQEEVESLKTLLRIACDQHWCDRYMEKVAEKIKKELPNI